MTEASSRQPRFAPGVPQRELRLVVEGISRWCAGLTEKRGDWRSCGFVEGPPGAGQAEIVESLGSVCRPLGVGVLSVRSMRGAATGPRLTAELARQLLVEVYALAGHGTEGAVLSPQLEQELLRLTGGLAGEAPADSLAALEPEYQRMRLVDSLARSVLELGARRPLILTVENLASIEGLLLDVLRHFLRLAARRQSSPRAPRVLLIVTMERAEERQLLENFQGDGVDLASLTEFHVALRGYSRTDLCDATTRFLGEPAPTSAREEVMRVTEGNPRHIRWLLVDGKEAGVTDLRAQRRLAFAQIVERRFGRLSERQQQLLVVLSLLRRPVRARLLVALSESADLSIVLADETAGDLVAELTELASGLWLRTGMTTAIDEPAWFSICDGDVADLVLDSLGRDVGRGWRHRLGLSLVGVSGGHRADLGLAACDLLLDAGEYEDAARLATETTDTLRGISCFSEALELVERVLSESRRLAPSTRHSLSERRVGLLRDGGHSREALEVCESLLSVVGDQESIYRMRVLQVELYGRLGEHDDQIRVAKEMVEQLPVEVAPVRRANLFAELGHAYLAAHDSTQSLACLEECLRILPEGSFDHAQVRRVFELAVHLNLARGQVERALEVARGLARTRCPADKFQHKVGMFRQVAELELRLGRLADAETALHQGLSHANRSGSRWLVAEQLEALGHHWTECRNPSAALAYLEQAYGIYVDLGRTVEAANLRFVLLTLELELGFFGRARKNALAFAIGADYHAGALVIDPPLEPRARRKALRRFVKLAKSHGGRLGGEETLRWGRLLQDDGKVADALSLYRETLRGPLRPETRLDVYRAMGEIALVEGDADSALRFVEKGLAGAREGLDRDRVASAAAGVAAIYLRRGDLPRALDAAVRALRLVLEAPTAPVVLPSFLCLTDVLMECGAWEVARDLGRSAALVAQEVDDVRGELEARLRLCAILRELGDDKGSAVELDRVEKSIARLELPVLRCRLLLETAACYRVGGDYQRAWEAALQASSRARTLGTPTLLTRAIFALGSVQAAPANPRKNFLRALELLEQALARAAAERCPRLHWELLQALAKLHAGRGSVDVAEKYQERAAEVRREAFQHMPASLRQLGWVDAGTVPAERLREPEPVV